MKSYKKPVLNVERFTPNEFVASCGPTGVAYNFICDAGEPYRYWQPGIFGGGYWVTDDYPYKVVAENGETWSNYGPCEKTHTAPTTDEFLKGYIDNMHTPENENISVIIWKEKGGGWQGDNIHCTTKLNMQEWGTAKS